LLSFLSGAVLKKFQQQKVSLFFDPEIKKKAVRASRPFPENKKAAENRSGSPRLMC
jgi:hypothetical protein